MLSTTALALLPLLSLVSANTNFGLTLKFGHPSNNWEAPSNLIRTAPASTKNQCSEAGSFFCSWGKDAICSSSHTRTPPRSGQTCPLDWFGHKTEKCCIPKSASQSCDCGEGYSWNEGGRECSENNKPGKCKKNEWWHERSESCCESSWDSNPPHGSCPKGVSCPTGWFWHKDHKKCMPHHPRSPQPDCSDWDQEHQCCGGGGSSPSQAATKPHGYGKRAVFPDAQAALFPQTHLDRTFCPKNLHACTVYTPHGGEWSYECVDFETELEACGGCANGGGADCTAIDNAMSVGCTRGVCEVYTCKAGFNANGSECVAI